MSSPQLENGYTKIANEILDALIKFRVPGEQMQCLLLILRKTYGFNKKEDVISNSQFVSETGLNKSNVCRAIKHLTLKNIVIKKDNSVVKSDNVVVKSDNSGAASYCFNKDYHGWKRILEKKVVVKSDFVVVKSDNGLLSKVTDTKERKDTIQKTYILRFEDFWKIYPIKSGKKPCLEKWKKRHLDLIADKIILNVKKRVASDRKWQEGFIPNPLTYINQNRWEDEVQENIKKKSDTWR